MSGFDLMIWDCDGCLVDSEAIAAEAEARLVTRLGIPFTAQEYYERFTGVAMRTIFEQLERERGVKLFGQFDNEAYEAEVRDLLSEKLQAMPFVHETLGRLEVPMCVASGSVPSKLEHELRLTGLWDVFGGHVYSSELVARGKPAPDIFLYAAAQMGARPERSLVIEDSLAGVTAAKAAGMSVFAFVRPAHTSLETRAKMQALRPHATFGDMRELPALVAGWGRG